MKLITEFAEIIVMGYNIIISPGAEKDTKRLTLFMKIIRLD